MQTRFKLGIISALQEEQQGLIASLQDATIEHIGAKQYVQGSLWGMECVCVLSGIGKVAAATAATVLADRYEVTGMLLSGVAGSATRSVRVGDIVLAENSIQHDMDASPLFPRFEVPLTGLAKFASNPELKQWLAIACRQFIDTDFAKAVQAEDQAEFSITRPTIHQGLIGSGDIFIDDARHLTMLTQALPDLLAVEMEGAAVAQVCHAFGAPVAVMRIISDNANEASAMDFTRFIQRVASVYAVNIIRQFCQNLQITRLRI